MSHSRPGFFQDDDSSSTTLTQTKAQSSISISALYQS
jgi:hypothetical protein